MPHALETPQDLDKLRSIAEQIHADLQKDLQPGEQIVGELASACRLLAQTEFLAYMDERDELRTVSEELNSEGLERQMVAKIKPACQQLAQINSAKVKRSGFEPMAPTFAKHMSV